MDRPSTFASANCSYGISRNKQRQLFRVRSFLAIRSARDLSSKEP